MKKAREILERHGYRCVAQCAGPNGSALEFWGGRKGTVIVQAFAAPSDGVVTYCDWPTGGTWEELDAALKP